MKMSMVIGLILANAAGFGMSGNAFAHPGAPSRVKIEWEGSVQLAAGENTLNFKLWDLKEKRHLSDADLSVVHEKKLHVFAYDSALVEFHHLHPEYSKDTGLWSTPATLPVNGEYWFWAQGLVTSGKTDFNSNTSIEVTGGDDANEVTELLDVRTGSDGNSSVQMSATTLVAEKEVMPILTFSRLDGTPTALGTFLGEKAHIVAVPDDGDSLIHVHGMDMANPNQLMIHVKFPAKGSYRLWVQFVDDDVLKTVPLSVIVKK